MWGQTSAQCTWTCVKSCWQIISVCFNLLCVADGRVCWLDQDGGMALEESLNSAGGGYISHISQNMNANQTN